jgi:hypothetical protein
MYTNIFTPEQAKLLPLVAKFSKDFYLVGGTALALQLGHRHSIDFGLFSPKPFNNLTLRRKIERLATITKIHLQSEGEFTLRVNDIKTTFFQFQYPVPHLINLDKIISMPDPLTIAAMKAFAMGQRSKWKDYVDLYFLFQHYSLDEIILKTESLFGIGEFNSQLFRAQLAYHKDIDFREPVEWMPGFEVPKEKILEKLIDVSIS